MTDDEWGGQTSGGGACIQAALGPGVGGAWICDAPEDVGSTGYSRTGWTGKIIFS